MNAPVPLAPIFVDALFTHVLSPTGTPIEGIMATYAIDVPLLEQQADKVDGWIAELDPNFLTSGGGGWSFLNLCNDKAGRLWTGEHRVMEQLCVLALALGKAKWLFPRAMWDVMPGGMPYIGFDAPKR